MKNKIHACSICGKSPLTQDEISATLKFLGKGTLYCLPCLAEFIGFELEELEERIQHLKEEGCQYFS